MNTKEITGIQLLKDLQERLTDLSSESLNEVNNIVMLYDIVSFDSNQDIFIINIDD